MATCPPDSHWWADTARPHIEDWNPALLEQLALPADIIDWELARLSSGEKQRLALARLLAGQPAGLLLDEPTANLDPDNTDRVEQVVASYREQHQCPVLWVSHDPAQRERVAGQQREMRAGELQ